MKAALFQEKSTKRLPFHIPHSVSFWFFS